MSTSNYHFYKNSKISEENKIKFEENEKNIRFLRSKLN